VFKTLINFNYPSFSNDDDEEWDFHDDLSKLCTLLTLLASNDLTIDGGSMDGEFPVDLAW